MSIASIETGAGDTQANTLEHGAGGVCPVPHTFASWSRMISMARTELIARLLERTHEGAADVSKCSERRRQWLVLLAIDDAVFHYEGNFLQRGNVVEWISGDGDDIGEVTGLERADLILPGE